MNSTKFFIIVLIYFLATNSFAQSRVNKINPVLDPRGESDLTICSQNLENFGTFTYVKSRAGNITFEEYSIKQEALIKRFIAISCDVIAVQEILSENVFQAEEALKQLSEMLKLRSNRIFDYRTAESNDRRRRLGFLVAKDRANIINKVSYARVELPKIAYKQRQRYFSRGPLEIQLTAFGRGKSSNRQITIINFHFKSKSTKGGMDPTGLDFESYRVEMAEALRMIYEQRHMESVLEGKQVLVLLGDRNSHYDVASAKVLDGTIKLTDFQGSAPCRMSNRGAPLCEVKTASPPKLFSVLTNDPETKLLEGTHKYKNIYSWIDDILMPAKSLPFAWAEPFKEGNYDSGVFYKFGKASDHALVYTKLNW